jgi:hypothetical protein
MAGSANEIIKELSPAQGKKVEALSGQAPFQRISSPSSGETKIHLE